MSPTVSRRLGFEPVLLTMRNGVPAPLAPAARLPNDDVGVGIVNPGDAVESVAVRPVAVPTVTLRSVIERSTASPTSSRPLPLREGPLKPPCVIAFALWASIHALTGRQE